jgi:glyoxylase-like metal-dependent hydrolase (beta-lactamase superfamily II)
VKVSCLGGNDNNYSCKAYLILGNWNSLDDANTLVDVGVDDWIIKEIEGISTGVGKRPVEQIILTHSHHDHAGGLTALKSKYGCRALAFSEFNGVDELLGDGQRVRMGDRDFEVIQAPEHSSDSICLYCEEEGVIFTGDNPVKIMTAGGSYSRAYVQVLERLVRRRVITIYPGHDEPVTEKAGELLEMTLQNVKNSEILRCF